MAQIRNASHLCRIAVFSIKPTFSLSNHCFAVFHINIIIIIQRSLIDVIVLSTLTPTFSPLMGGSRTQVLGPNPGRRACTCSVWIKAKTRTSSILCLGQDTISSVPSGVCLVEYLIFSLVREQH